jgi:hypothetical protein
MSKFKILAVRALNQTPNHVLKALKVNEIYKFHQNYSFKDANGEEIIEGNEVFQIIDEGPNLDNLFKVKEQQNLYISAIVGKNGSGKSSLNELIYLLNFLIASTEELNMIDSIDPLTRSYFFPKSTPKHLKEVEELKLLFKKTHLELYYQSEKNYARVVFENDSIRRELIKDGEWIVDEIDKKNPSKLDRKRHFLSEFSYTVAINYSLYGLNGDEQYWLNPLFHKNDGYQIPIVINPYREGGTITINNEQHLAQSRLLSNLSAIRNRNVVNNKKIHAVKLLIIPEDLDSIGPFSIQSLLNEHERTHKVDFITFFNQISKAIIGKTLLNARSANELKEFIAEMGTKFKAEKYNIETYAFTISELATKYFLIKYVVRKVFKVCLQQQEYKSKFLIDASFDSPIKPFSLKNLTGKNGLYSVLSRDKSHVTLKLRQALYCLKENIYFDNWKKVPNPNNSNHIAFETQVQFLKYQQIVNTTIANNPELRKESLEAIPNALFRPTILIRKEEDANSKSGFKQLSSGEQQYINTFQTAIYHLRNLNSVHECGDTEKIAYKNVNLIFDEIELYFHPEFQQVFIFELLAAIKRTKLPYIKSINVLFSTHSPFILSDIPTENILKLGDSLNTSNWDNKTFGANIHDLLANEFFLREGFMGEFAKSFISRLIKEVKSLTQDQLTENTFNELESRANLIGEPVIKNSIMSLIRGKFNEHMLLQKRRLELEKELEIITNKLINRHGTN